MTNRVNHGGRRIDYDAAVELMNDDLRETLHSSQEWAGDQEFFDAYLAAHETRYGTLFVIN